MSDLRKFRESSSLIAIVQCTRKNSFGYQYKLICKDCPSVDISEVAVQSFRKLHVPILPVTLEESLPRSGMYIAKVNSITCIYDSIHDDLIIDNTMISFSARKVFMDDIFNQIFSEVK